jgi:8-oxo-dGTP pyrophosphatase MutT (NUDIX family)
MTAAGQPLDTALAGYRPADDTEAADLARVRRLLADADDPWRRDSPLHLTASAVVVHPGTGRVLLRWHARQRAWLQIGGHADPGEDDLLTIAVREAREETGLDDLRPWPGPDIVHLVVVPAAASATEPAHEHADLRLVLATGQPDMARPENPAAALRWLPVAQAAETTTEANLRVTLDRVAALLAAATPPA